MSATIHFALLTVSGRAGTGATLPVPDSAVVASAEATTTASSALVVITDALPGHIWRCTVTGGNAYVKFGTGTPDASAAASRHKLVPGVYEFAVGVAGEKPAIMDAP